MEIKDKERFMRGMLDIFASVNGISCTDLSNELTEEYVQATTEEMIEAYARHVLSKGDDIGKRFEDQTRAWIKEWVQNGPVFIMFNQPGLMAEVNDYIKENYKDERCNKGLHCGDK